MGLRFPFVPLCYSLSAVHARRCRNTRGADELYRFSTISQRYTIISRYLHLTELHQCDHCTIYAPPWLWIHIHSDRTIEILSKKENCGRWSYRYLWPIVNPCRQRHTWSHAQYGPSWHRDGNVMFDWIREECPQKAWFTLMAVSSNYWSEWALLALPWTRHRSVGITEFRVKICSDL